ncbi:MULTISPECIES: hypothetical protein [unclassified Paenibacillus]|uniref:hypothetical protein n=1 Tax=unclassified Paenibacillus TaxID=185978 RepID=UPI001AE7B2BF|nr:MULTISPECIES: hypothetical protein [unclassified Paenibacillus]MBP1153933.1 hypothetical protein [Paenibacillus sp. PvP091]MBP1170682.1 hypothetical protein [Paenibacillus sp. PvR098]MBP2441710.1 hypothetical protein [Paenibacillus sp. PvP052]
MSKRSIKDEATWELGQSYGMTKAMQRFMDHYFDQIKAEYFKMLREMNDLDLVDKMNDVIFSTRITRDDLVLMLKLIEHQHMEQMKRNHESNHTQPEG